MIWLYLAALLAGSAATALSLPFWRAWCRKAGLVDDPGHRKIHAEAIPLAGGPAVLSGLLIPILVGAAAVWAGMLDAETSEKLGYGFTRRFGQLLAILGGGAGMLLLGALDDRIELRAGTKFAGQFIIAAAVAAAGIRITLFVPSPVFHYVVTVLWILTVTNAFNFSDNMNGLCGGLGAIAALLFGGISAVHGQYLVAALSFLIGGALTGFLPFNFPRATVFLGDSGSHLVGFLMAVLAILPHFYTEENPRMFAVLSPLLILAVPLADLVWVVLLRWRQGRPFYVGDTNHISHQLVRRGLKPARAVALIWLSAAVLGGLVFLWI